MAKNKTDNFLKAIRKYANAQKNAMRGEVKQLKAERLKEAEEKAKYDSEQLKKQKLTEIYNRRTAKLAKKTQDCQRALFVERASMTENIFADAEKKLVDFTQTDAYYEKLKQSAQEISELFDGKNCVLYLNGRDLDHAQELAALFGGSAEVKEDKTIKIGGIKGYCADMGIIADETLDSKLDAQREWFVENATLSVL